MLSYFVTIVSPCFGANACVAPNAIAESRIQLRSFVFIGNPLSMRFFYYFTPFGVLVLIIHDLILKSKSFLK